jgi:hypothetical protein
MAHTSELAHLPFLRKLVLGGGAPLLWNTYSVRQYIANRIFGSIPNLATILIGVECWERGKDDRVGLMISYPDEWKDDIWRDGDK